MRFDLDMGGGGHQIRGYSPGSIKIDETTYHHSLIVTADNIIEWPPKTLEDIHPEHLEVIIKLKPDVVLIGTGSQLIFPEPALLQPFYQANIGTEVMNTAAACRTYSVIKAEGRYVAAALFL